MLSRHRLTTLWPKRIILENTSLPERRTPAQSGNGQKPKAALCGFPLCGFLFAKSDDEANSILGWSFRWNVWFANPAVVRKFLDLEYLT
jgi:hypothetical protein